MKKELKICLCLNYRHISVKLIGFVLTYILLASTSILGQYPLKLNKEYTVETFDESKGLFNREVNGLVFDKQGLGWLGNGDGLNLFDGKRIYKSSDYFNLANTLLSEPVQAIIYDSTYNKLIVFSYAKTRTNIYVLHLEKLKQTNYLDAITLISSVSGPLNAWPIYQHNRLIAIIKSVVLVFDLHQFKVMKIRVSNLQSMALYFDKSNHINVVAVNGYTYKVLIGAKDTQFKFVHKYTREEAEYIWQKSLFSDLKTNPIETFRRASNIEKIVAKSTLLEYIQKKFTGIVEDPLGNYYLCGHDWGVQKFVPLKKIMKTVSFFRETRAICYSPQLDKGAIATPIGIKPFSLKDDSIRNMIRGDNFYFSTSVPINDSLNCVFPLYPQSDSIHRAYLYNKKNAKLIMLTLDIPLSITNYSNLFLQLTLFSSYKAQNGIIYLGTNHGICTAELKGTQMSIKPIGALQKEHVNAIIASYKTGYLLAATETGIYEININTKKTSQIREGAFLSLLRYSRGWIAGSRQNGAYLFDFDNKLLLNLNTKNGIHSNTIFCISFDKLYQTLWLGTSNGLSMYQTRTGLLKTYFKKDGILNNEFNRESTFNFPNDSLILMGGIAGITAIRNRAMFYTDIQKLTPKIWGVDAVFDNNQQLKYYVSESKLLNSLSPRIRKLIFHLTDYSSENQLYSVLYKIDEYNWQGLTRGDDIEVLNVDAGEHKLEVKVITADGKESVVNIINYYVEPIWYKSWWGLLLFVLLGALLMLPILMAHNRITQVRAQEELYKNREKLYGIIAHDLRSPLSAYQGLADVIKYLIEKQDWERLQIIGKEIDDTGRHLDLMLNNLLNWSLIQQKELKSYFVSTDLSKILKDFLPVYQTLAKAKDITLLADIEQTTTLVIDRNLSSLVIRNLLDNAVKNAPEGSFIKMKINKEAQNMVILIENDFLANSLPIINEIVNNINTPNWELQRGVGLKFVIQALNLMQATTEVTIVGNFNRLRWYIKIPCL